MKPHKCPVCDGSGLVSRPPGVAGDQETWTSNSVGPYQCRSCNGEGLLWMDDRDEPNALVGTFGFDGDPWSSLSHKEADCQWKKQGDRWVCGHGIHTSTHPAGWCDQGCCR